MNTNGLNLLKRGKKILILAHKIKPDSVLFTRDLLPAIQTG